MKKECNHCCRPPHLRLDMPEVLVGLGRAPNVNVRAGWSMARMIETHGASPHVKVVYVIELAKMACGVWVKMKIRWYVRCHVVATRFDEGLKQVKLIGCATVQLNTSAKASRKKGFRWPFGTLCVLLGACHWLEVEKVRWLLRPSLISPDSPSSQPSTLHAESRVPVRCHVSPACCRDPCAHAAWQRKVDSTLHTLRARR